MTVSIRTNNRVIIAVAILGAQSGLWGCRNPHEAAPESNRDPASRLVAEVAPGKGKAVEAPSEVDGVAEPESREMRDKRARLQCMALAQDSFSGVDWKWFKSIASKPDGEGILVSIDGKTRDQPYVLACHVDNQGELTHRLYRSDLKSKDATEAVNVPPPCPQGFTSASVCKPAKKEPAAARVSGATPREQCVNLARTKHATVNWDLHEIAELTPNAVYFITGTYAGKEVMLTCEAADGKIKYESLAGSGAVAMKPQ